MLELYHYEPYANSMKVLMCLEEKGLDYVRHYVDILKFEQHEPAFVALNPNGQVPVLVHDGRVIVESTVINEYLDDVFPEVPLRPTDPGDRADMRAWSKFVDEVLMSSVSMLGWQTRFRPLFRDADPAELERRFARIPLKEMQVKWATTVGPGFSDAELDDSRRKIRLAIERMEAMLAGADWLAGPAYSLADINAYPMIEGAARLYPEAWTAEHAARSMDWLARINARPATQAAFATSRHGNAPGKAADAA